MFWKLVLTVLLLSSSPAAAQQPRLTGVHAGLACQQCHDASGQDRVSPSALESRASGCTPCHQGYDRIFDQAMTTRQAEKQFCQRTFAGVDDSFFAANCSSCHVSDCLDCHGGDGHRIAAQDQNACLTCHRGYFVGREYLGMAPREDHPRYQRGPEFMGQHYLKMRPDVHAEAGLECRDCHSMQSLLAGEPAAKRCRDCHQPDPEVVEHRIAGHLEKLECYACHSAWAPQEYGTFYLRIGRDNKETARRFRPAAPLPGDYLTRAYLRRQDVPPLGINAAGRVSPIRPQFIAYYSDLRGDGRPVVDNRLLAAEWKAFFPHTVRRGSVMCDACHDDRRRFLLEPPEDRIYRIDREGLGLSSFWDQQGQTVSNGAFVSPQQFSEITRKDAAYTRAYVERWQKLTGHGDASSN